VSKLGKYGPQVFIAKWGLKAYGEKTNTF